VNRAPVTFAEALRVWVQVALQSFGGPAGQIAVMHRLLVEERRWVSEGRFLHALNYCMLLPGPEAQQLATYLGWLLHGVRGGLAAGLLFILPGFLSILALSYLYVLAGDVTAVQGLFFGLAAAVIALVAQAVLRIGRRVLRSSALWAIALLAFLGIALFDLPFPAIVAGAAVVGSLGWYLWPAQFPAAAAHGPARSEAGQGAEAELGAHTAPSLGRLLRALAIFGGAWALPVAGLYLVLGPAHVFSEQAGFFSRAALVTFGGAYAVLSYIAEAGVEVYGWLAPGEMLDGLAMAETTPGPLIQVVQFVGFLGAYRDPGGLSPLLAAGLGSLVTTWVTFAPCFLWIFAGAPYVEALRGVRWLSAALSSLTAAVVGVIAHLALWFTLHALFGLVGEGRLGPLHYPVPQGASFDLAAASLAGAALVAAFGFGVKPGRLLVGCALVGVGLRWAGLG
jgi:chromate transporter